MNTIHEKHHMIGREADKYGHLIDASLAKGIEQRRMPAPMLTQADTKVSRWYSELHFARVLVPTDLTDDSRKAVNYALNLTKLVGGESILLLHW